MGRFVTTLKRQVGRDVDHLPVGGSPVSAWGVGAAYAMSQSPIATPALLSEAAPAAEAQSFISPSALETFMPMDEPSAWANPVPQDVVPAIKPTLPEVEDGRLFSFDRVKPLRNLSGTPIRLRVALPVKGTVTVPHGVAVEAKAETIMCIRRKMRRGVILALGQGGGYHKPPRRSPKSDIWC